MIAIAAIAAFIALFTLWVIVPRYLIQRKENANANLVSSLTQEQANTAPQAAD